MSEEALLAMKKDELLALAKSMGIQGVSTANTKTDIAAAILAAQTTEGGE